MLKTSKTLFNDAFPDCFRTSRWFHLFSISSICFYQAFCSPFTAFKDSYRPYSSILPLQLSLIHLCFVHRKDNTHIKVHKLEYPVPTHHLIENMCEILSFQVKNTVETPSSKANTMERTADDLHNQNQWFSVHPKINNYLHNTLAHFPILNLHALSLFNAFS